MKLNFIGEVYYENETEVQQFFEREVDEVSEWREGKGRSETTYTIFRDENGINLLSVRASFPESVSYRFIEIINP